MSRTHEFCGYSKGMRLAFLLILFVAAMVRAQSLPAPPAWVAKSNQNAQLLIAILARYAPESAAQLPGCPSQLPDSRTECDPCVEGHSSFVAAIHAGFPKCRAPLPVLIQRELSNQAKKHIQRGADQPPAYETCGLLPDCLPISRVRPWIP